MAKLVMREIYERSYGIHDHADGRLSPLHLVTLHTKENTSEFSARYNRHRRYVLLDVFKHTGLSMTDFFNRPREDVELDFRIITDTTLQKSNAKNDIPKDL